VVKYNTSKDGTSVCNYFRREHAQKEEGWRGAGEECYIVQTVSFRDVLVKDLII